MTEQEAKTKWCPQVRYPNLMVGGQVASNIYSDGCNVNSNGDRTPPAFCCIGSGCMMWKKYRDGEGRTPTELIENIGGGYCGLAK